MPAVSLFNAKHILLRKHGISVLDLQYHGDNGADNNGSVNLTDHPRRLLKRMLVDEACCVRAPVSIGSRGSALSENVFVWRGEWQAGAGGDPPPF